MTPPDDVTIAPFDSAQARPLGPSGSSALRASLFAPGSIIAGRYRLVALLGRGGMGEVYRAEDLTLDHPVALKFLPEGAANSPASLSQFHNELRIARQVSHKNVCRLYDLGEADGRRFLTMEYVDGEDLASLIRRIGRIQQDKAIDIARQICAGLAAAHERGVLHHDLKPANVMLDGEGNVRITDFGLALRQGSGDAIAAGDADVVRAGTPQYMAPEQLAPRSVVGHGLQAVPPATIKSDIYALGLVLFEIFTGRRAFEAKTLRDLLELHESGTAPLTPSSVVRDLDPTVERIIMRCLERDPERRPGSALAVAAALPGGNPLAEALAAGETPSPDLVVAAGETDAVAVLPGLAAAALFIVSTIVFAAFAPRASMPSLVPLNKPVDVLTDRAQQLLSSFGYEEAGADRARGFSIPPDYPQWAQAHGGAGWWSTLRSGRPAGMLFWYRTSPRDLVPDAPRGSVMANDPPQLLSGMSLVVLDTVGRLVEFHHVPPQVDSDATPAAAPEWPRVFDAAGLPFAAFTPAAPQWAPKNFADTRGAWEGSLPDRTDIRVRVEAASYRGHPVSFYIVGPWSRPSQMPPASRTAMQTVMGTINVGVWLAALIGGAILARYNVRMNRADRRAAARLAIGLTILAIAAWIVSAHHVTTADVELQQTWLTMASAVFLGTIVWLYYLAIEPYARRFWPDALLGWTRLLAGRVRDPRVGRDVLIGLLIGVAFMACETAQAMLPQRFGYPAPQPRFGSWVPALASTSMVFTKWVNVLNSSLQSALFIMLFFVVLRLVIRRAWIAAVVGAAIITVLSDNGEAITGSRVDTVMIATIIALATYAIFRHGLLVLVVASFADNVLTSVPLTLHTTAWWATPSNLTLALFILIACFGYYAARAGQPIFGSPAD